MAVVPQAYRQPCLILNLLESPDKGTPSVNGVTNREVAPELIQFGRDFFGILQEIWEADPAQGPVRVSKLYVTDTFHRGTIHLSQVDAFKYVVPSAPDDDCIIIYIDLVLLMG